MQKPFSTQLALFVSAAELGRPALHALDWVPARGGGVSGDSAGPGPDAAPDETYVFIIANLEPDIEYTTLVTPMLDDAPFGGSGDATGRPLRKAVVAIGAARGAAGIVSSTVVEGEDAELAVALDAPTRARVTVAWTTEDDTAKAGEDYRSMSGCLAFPPGAASATLRIPTRQDSRVDPEETFRVRLTETIYADRNPDALPRR